MGVAVCTLFFLSLGWLEVTKVARRKVNEQLGRVQKRLGVPVEVGKLTIGFGGAHFDDLRIGTAANVVVSRVSAEIGLNPLSDTFGELASVTVYKIRIKSPLSKFNGSVQALSDAGSETAGDGMDEGAQELAEKSLEKLFRALPTERLVVRSGVVTLVDDGGKPQVTVKGLELLIDRRARKALFKIAQLRGAGGLAESYLQGRLEMNPKSPDFRFFVRRKLRANGAPAKLNAWSVSGDLAKDLAKANLRFETRTVPSFLAPHLAPLLGEKPRARIAGELSFVRQGEAYEVDIRAKSLSMKVEAPLLSKQLVGPVRFALEASGSYRPETRLLAIETATIRFPDRERGAYGDQSVRLAASGALRLPSDERPGLALQGQLQLAPTGCQAALDASPAGFLPALEDFKLAGDIEGGLDFNFDSSREDSVYFELHKPRFDCRVVSEPYEYSAEHLGGPFTVQREVDKGADPDANDSPAPTLSALKLDMNPTAPTFTPLSEIAGSVSLSFVASEDQGFYQHHGIDVFALENAVHRNFREGKVAVGGSTITMQTVKNLFLTHDRTIARKLQEVFLAWHLENVLSKERILEIYLNIVEFGPGIYGITQASQHFFNKHPFDLTLTESAYLALLLPSPKSRYLYFCRGELTPAFETQLSGLLKRMLNLGRITYDRYAQAAGQEIQFNGQARTAAKGCSIFDNHDRQDGDTGEMSDLDEGSQP